MTTDMTPRMQHIFSQQILVPEDVKGGYLQASTMIQVDADDQYLLLVFADGRWACYHATREAHHDGWQHTYQMSVELVTPDTVYFNMHHLMRSLHDAGVIPDDIWDEEHAFEQQQYAERMAAERETRERAQVAREVKHEQTRQQKLDDAFERALRLKYGNEATDRGLRQMRAAEKRRQVVGEQVKSGH